MIEFLVGVQKCTLATVMEEGKPSMLNIFMHTKLPALLIVVDDDDDCHTLTSAWSSTYINC